MTEKNDVTIVGGGPAGLAAAITLGRRGLSVVVLDRQSLPADKVCGEGVMPPGMRFLEEVGAAPLISPADKYPFAGIRYFSPSGHCSEAPFEAGPGRGIRRPALAAALREVASNYSNVRIIDQIRVTSVQREGALMETRCEDGTAFRSRLVVGADGLRSRVRRWAGLEGRPSKQRRFGTRQHFAIPPWTRFVEVHIGKGVEAYVTPCGPNCIGLAFLWDPAAVPDVSNGRELFRSLLGRFPRLQERLARSGATGPARSMGPFAQRTKSRVADGIALLGDASGYLDPCTGEGLTLAFKQAGALESCLGDALTSRSDGLLTARTLRAYDLAWKRITRSYFLCTRFMLICQRHPRVVDTLIRATAKNPDLLRHFLSFNMGMAPFLPGVRRTARWFLPRGASHAENS